MITHLIKAPKLTDTTGNIDLGHIELFRDHEDPFKFYYLNNTPRLQFDQITKRPVFDYTIFARGINTEEERFQQGHFIMGVDLHLTKEELEAIRKAVDNFANPEQIRKDKEQYYPNYKGNCYGKAMICPVNFTKGNVMFYVGASALDGTAMCQAKPNLNGNCNAIFSANYGSYDSQILYESFKPRDKKNEYVASGVTVRYELMYNAILSFKASVSINQTKIYKLLQDLLHENKGTDAKYYGRVDVEHIGTVYSNGVNLYVSHEFIDNLTRNSSYNRDFITVKIENLTNNEQNTKYENLVIEALSKRISNEVCSSLFEKVEPLDPNNVRSPHDVEKSKDNDGNDKKLGNYDVDYKLKNNITISEHSTFNFSIEKNEKVELEHNPQCNLNFILDGVDIKDLVTECDASQLYFQKMAIPITVDAANFEKDILQINVKVKYPYGKNPREETFTFDSENSNSKIFYVVMARDEAGNLIDKFSYRTKIVYRGYDVYGKQGDNYSEPKESKGYNEPIVITYVDIRNLCVNCSAGDVAWDEISKIDVEFKYKDAPEKKGGTKLITLTPSNISDQWNCYMYNGNGIYTYRVRYYYQDGSEEWTDVKESTITELAINDNLSGMYMVNFDVDFQESISRVRVKVRSQGEEDNSGWIKEADEWIWQKRLKEDLPISYSFMYEYYLVNDSERKSSGWSKEKTWAPKSNIQYESIILGMKKIKIELDADGLDWQKWDKVILFFRYDDPTNNIHYTDEDIDPIKLTKDKTEDKVTIAVKDTTIRPKVTAHYISEGREYLSDEIDAPKNYIIIPGSIPPKEDVAVRPSKGNTSSTLSSNDEKEYTASPAPIKKEINLTIKGSSIDWEKWYRAYIDVSYDDDANDIHYHYNEESSNRIRFTAKSHDDVTIPMKIKDSTILPKVKVKYVEKGSCDEFTSDEVTVNSDIVELPNDAPPQSKL